jgi:hypothetical protein
MRQSAHNIALQGFVAAMRQAEEHRKELHDRYGYSTAQLTRMLAATQYTNGLRDFATAALAAKRNLAARQKKGPRPWQSTS